MKILTAYDGPVEITELDKPTLIYSWNTDTKLPCMAVYRNPDVDTVHLLKVTLDNFQEIVCPFKQIFFTFRGGKIEAKDLKEGQSIRAYTVDLHERDGHLRVFGYADGKVKHKYVARMIWEYYHGDVPEGLIIHHRDFDKLNNRLSNLELLDNSQHNSVHYPFRRDGGFFRGKNHKVLSVEKLGNGLFYYGEVDSTHTFVIADDKPVAGICSGVVSAF